MEFFKARREAYEERGIFPTIPPSLSSDPNDPEYRIRNRVFDFIKAVRDEQPSTFCTY